MAGDTRGRKPKLNKKAEQQLILLAEAGVPKEVACAVVGIDSRTLRIWMERARAGEAPFVALASKLETAQAKAQSSILVKIRKAGDRDWKALAWVLERCFSERYGYKSQVKVSVEAELEKMLDVATNVLGPESAAKLFAAIAGEAGLQAPPPASGASEPVH